MAVSRQREATGNSVAAEGSDSSQQWWRGEQQRKTRGRPKPCCEQAGWQQAVTGDGGKDIV